MICIRSKMQPSAQKLSQLSHRGIWSPDTKASSFHADTISIVRRFETETPWLQVQMSHFARIMIHTSVEMDTQLRRSVHIECWFHEMVVMIRWSRRKNIQVGYSPDIQPYSPPNSPAIDREYREALEKCIGGSLNSKKPWRTNCLGEKVIVRSQNAHFTV